MNCTRCGANLPENAIFCTNCANPNPSMPQAPPPPPGYGPPGYVPSGYGPVPNIPDYLVWSIVTTLCCQPFGIAAIVFSVMTMSEKSNGRFDSAMKNSRMAKKMVMIGLIGWAVLAVCYFLFIILMIVSGAADNIP